MKKILFSLFLTTSFFVITLFAQDVLPIGEVQGEGDFSPYADKEVTVQGVVTAVGKRGFYIQTPDEEVDANPKTSEGIYIFTLDQPPVDITPGINVRVKGTVAEYRRESDSKALFFTQIVKSEITIVAVDHPLPSPVLLTREILNPNGRVDQLERFEGMRVKIDELLVVAPTGGYFNTKEGQVISDGVFYGVLAGTPRPFREPGLDASKVLIDKMPETLSIFDMNPELIRIDSKALDGKILDVTSGASIKNIIGIIDYNLAAYTLLIDPRSDVAVENNRTFVPASAASEDEVTVASFNLENFFDDEENSDLPEKETIVSSLHFEKRLKKASLAIRNVVSMPDVLGVIEVENLVVLKKLADRINSDALAAGEPDPKYEAVLLESNDPRGIDVGYLVKTAKVKVLSYEQLAKDTKLDHPQAAAEEKLFSRPPILAKFEVPNEDPEKAFNFTLIVNHFKSYRGIEGKLVQDKKRMQSEFLAKFVSEREISNPNERLILIGDFNSFQFNDGYNDLIGTLKGEPDKNVISPSETTYQTGLLALVDYISPENRYSYIFGGSAQVLDHILVNNKARAVSTKFGYARLNADFPRIYGNDETRPERASDHDVPVLYLSTLIDAPKSDTEVRAKESDNSPAETNSTTTIESSLFYSFDSKTSVESDISIDEWAQSKVLAAEEDQTEFDIFEHSAGGPNRAEWNPVGELYLMISIRNTDAESPEVVLNGVEISGLEIRKMESAKPGDTCYWIRLPEELWMDNLRAINDGDLEGLYGKEWVESVALGEIGTVAPLNTGKIIEFEIRLGDRVIKKYFHAAFGE